MMPGSGSLYDPAGFAQHNPRGAIHSMNTVYLSHGLCICYNSFPADTLWCVFFGEKQYRIAIFQKMECLEKGMHFKNLHKG